jgi:hypothetical protein
VAQLPGQNAGREVPLAIHPAADALLQPSITYRDLELMHNFCTNTYGTIARFQSDTRGEFWRMTVPEEAQTHPFLMHCILSISALHIAAGEMSKRSTYGQLAVHHYSLALNLFRKSTKDITQSNVRSVSASIVLIGLISVAQINICAIPSDHTVENLLSPIFTIRRSANFFGSVLNRVNTKEMDLEPPHMNKVPYFLACPKVCQAMRGLRALTNDLNDGSPESLALRQAVQYLHLSYGFTSTRPFSWQRMLFWPRAVSDTFMDLLQQQNPISMVLAAYWAVPVYYAPYRWFMDDWPGRLIMTVARELGDQWAGLLAWPLEQIITGDLEQLDLVEPLD